MDRRGVSMMVWSVLYAVVSSIECWKESRKRNIEHILPNAAVSDASVLWSVHCT